MKLAPRGAMQAGADTVLRPVVGLDVDGTLADYHFHFLNFAAQWLCRGDGLVREWWDYDGSVPLATHMHVSKTTYRQIKLAYRQGGLKRSMPVMTGAPELVRAVRAAGAEVWVCTTRPHLRLDNIDPDTRFWLRHNGLTYDGVLFGERKYRDLQKLVGSERVVGVLDDLPEQVSRALTLGLPAYMIENSYNLRAPGRALLPTLPRLTAAQELFLGEIKKWKANHDVG